MYFPYWAIDWLITVEFFGLIIFMQKWPSQKLSFFIFIRLIILQFSHTGLIGWAWVDKNKKILIFVCSGTINNTFFLILERKNVPDENQVTWLVHSNNILIILAFAIVLFETKDDAHLHITNGVVQVRNAVNRSHGSVLLYAVTPVLLNRKTQRSGIIGNGLLYLASRFLEYSHRKCQLERRGQSLLSANSRDTRRHCTGAIQAAGSEDSRLDIPVGPPSCPPSSRNGRICQDTSSVTYVLFGFARPYGMTCINRCLHLLSMCRMISEHKQEVKLKAPLPSQVLLVLSLFVSPTDNRGRRKDNRHPALFPSAKRRKEFPPAIQKEN